VSTHVLIGEKTYQAQFLLDMVKKRIKLFLPGRHPALGRIDRLAGVRHAGLKPFVRDQQDRLGKVQRSQAGVERDGNHVVRHRNVLVLKTGALGSEHNRDRRSR